MQDHSDQIDFETINIRPTIEREVPRDTAGIKIRIEARDNVITVTVIVEVWWAFYICTEKNKLE